MLKHSVKKWSVLKTLAMVDFGHEKHCPYRGKIAEFCDKTKVGKIPHKDGVFTGKGCKGAVGSNCYASNAPTVSLQYCKLSSSRSIPYVHIRARADLECSSV
jgi:hypothetical protein